MKEYLGILIDTSRDQIIPEKGLALLSKKGFYKKDNETSPQETMARAATCYCFGDYDFAQRMYDYQSKGWYVDSSPVKSNAVEILWPTFDKNQFQEAGDWLEENVTADGLPISCFLSSIPDTKEGLTETRTETAWLSMMGGGVGVYTGNRSPDEKSTGVMAHLKGYDADTLSYKQKESRRGSIAAYMDINHPEIKQFITMRDPAGGGDINKKCFNLNNAVNLTDDFMWKVISGEEYELVDPKHGPTGEYLSARKVFEELMEMRHQTGEPYLNFIDTVNKSRRPWITKKSYYVTQSNLCVAPETQILTRDGYTPIAELEGQTLDIWNGEEWSEVTPTKTGEDQKLVKVTTSAGQVLECTEYHKWYVFDGYGKPCFAKETKDLVVGDKLIKFDLPVIEGVMELPYAYDNGFFSGDGSHSNGKPIIYLYGEKIKLKKHLPSVYSWYDQEAQDRAIGRSNGLAEKFFVPTDRYTIASRLRWLAGFLDADGCVYRNGSNEAITACSVNFTFLQEIQLMLQTLGVSCKISDLYDEGYRNLPANNGTGENKPFFCKKSYRLLITSYDTFKLTSLGLEMNRLRVKVRRPQRDAKQFNKVVSVSDEGRVSDTYCFTETKRGMGMFNGILTGNCNEIHLMTSSKRTAVCCLSSLNLAKYDEWKDTNIVQDLCRYLDNVLEYFIRLAPPQLKRAVHSASQERAIGIGTLGWHSLLQSKNLAFESGGANSASSLNYEVYSHIESEFIKASQQLAVERGEPEDCIGGGMRNSHGIAIAPNVSSADMVGESCSIEPWKSNAFVAQGRSGSFLVKNKYLEKVLEELGKNNKGTWKRVLDNDGSVRDLEFMSDHHKKVFATAKEIDPMWIIEHAALRQPMICQGQSVNTFKDNNWTIQDMVDLHIAAWAKGLKGLYYMRGEAAESVNFKEGDSVKPPLNQVRPVFKLDECLSCHG